MPPRSSVRVGCATYIIVLLATLAAGTSYLAYEKTEMPPVRYVAVRGDTLSTIATANGVSIDRVKDWNWKVEDPIEPNQVVVVWPKGRPLIEDILDAIHILSARWAPGILDQPLKATLAPVAWTTDGVQVGGDNADEPLPIPKPQPCAKRRVIEPIRPGDPPRARAGLTNEQINAAMAAFLPRGVACVEKARNPGILKVAMVVGCDGVVAKAEQVGDSGYPGDVVDCVIELVRHVPFPAHDDDEGTAFEYEIDLKP